jgi:hypothetical protein
MGVTGRNEEEGGANFGADSILKKKVIKMYTKSNAPTEQKNGWALKSV